jgi:hypothetical protein
MGVAVLNPVHPARARAIIRAFAVVSVCAGLLAISLVPASASAASPAVDMVMSVGDGGSPFVAQADAFTTSTPSGTWTVTVRNTGTSASSGTTTIQIEAGGTGYFLTSAGSGWSCADTGDRVRTCTNAAAVPAELTQHRPLKRRISDAIFARLKADASRAAPAAAAGPGEQPGNDSVASAADSHPEHRLFGQATPEPATTLRPRRGSQPGNTSPRHGRPRTPPEPLDNR